MAAGEPATEEQRLQRALDYAYAHVNRRERTVAEVRAHLAGKGISEPLSEAAVQALLEQGFVNDERFAEMFITDKRELEQWGSERIRRGLQTRGIDRELAERALAEAERATSVDGAVTTEWERALELVRRRFPDPPRDRRERDRALGVLIRKGYDGELALDVLAAHARGD